MVNDLFVFDTYHGVPCSYIKCLFQTSCTALVSHSKTTFMVWSNALLSRTTGYSSICAFPAALPVPWIPRVPRDYEKRCLGPSFRLASSIFLHPTINGLTPVAIAYFFGLGYTLHSTFLDQFGYLQHTAKAQSGSILAPRSFMDTSA